MSYNNTSLAIKYDTDHGEVELSPDIVKKYLVSGNGNVTDQEIILFLKICQYQQLNPYLREAYLVKYGNETATIITGKEVFTKRAAKIQKCAGWEAGVTLIKKNGDIERRTGSLVLEDEKLVAGWCKVYIKGWTVPVTAEPSLKEYQRKKKDGTIMKNWAETPATMIRKTAIVQALRDAFPEYFQGLYSQEEMPVDDSLLETTPVNPTENNAQMHVIPAVMEQPRAQEAKKPPLQQENKLTKNEISEIYNKAETAGLIYEGDNEKKNWSEFNQFAENLKQMGQISTVFPYGKDKSIQWTRDDYIVLIAEIEKISAEQTMSDNSDSPDDIAEGAYAESLNG